MSIGTAKPSQEELTQAPHHFINSLSIHDRYSAGDFERDALHVLQELFSKHDIVVMAGGSGLFVRAVCEGLDELPKPVEGVREKLNHLYAQKGLQHMQELLRLHDPAYFQEVDNSNPQRIIRALEVYESTGFPFSHFRKKNQQPRPFRILSIGLQMPRQTLYDRINLRVDNMMAKGLEHEAKELYGYRDLPPLITVGYSEIFDYLDGKLPLAAAIAAIKQNTRRFAKRQLTWFKRDERTHWHDPSDIKGIFSLIQEHT